MNNDQIKVMFAEEEHCKYAGQIVDLIYESALQRGTGIARRSPEYIAQKIKGGKAVVALCDDRLIGFSYIESWEHGDYVATSGLIVDPEFRRLGLAARIKAKTFELARLRFPFAKIFSITTSLPVMKLNSNMGYKPVTFSSSLLTRSSGRDARDVSIMTSFSATIVACVCAQACCLIPRQRWSVRPRAVPIGCG